MDLRGALADDEFFLVYQPTLRPARDGADRRRGADPLAPPGSRRVQPNDFIPLLEETGLIVAVGRWVLQRGMPAGRALAPRRDTRSASPSTSPAASSTPTSSSPTSSTRSPTAALTPAALTLEITETTLMRNAEETALRLRAIKEPRRAHRDRRLRHRLLLARPPAALPRRRAQDRPLLHPRSSPRTPRARRSSARSCSSARRSRSRRSPRASSSREQLSLLRRSSATAARASCSPSRSRSRPRRPSCRTGAAIAGSRRSRHRCRVEAAREPGEPHAPPCFAPVGAHRKRMKGFEPSTFAMARRRSSQLSYIRATAAILAPRARRGPPLGHASGRLARTRPQAGAARTW